MGSKFRTTKMESKPEAICKSVLVPINKMDTNAHLLINPDNKEVMPCTEYMYSTASLSQCLRDMLKKTKNTKKRDKKTKRPKKAKKQ